jgi:hypothetical protein
MVVSRALLSRDLLKEIEVWLSSQVAEQPTTNPTFKLMQVLSALCFHRPQLRGASMRKIPPRKRHQPTEACPLLPEDVLPDCLSGLGEKFNQRVIDNVVSRIEIALSGVKNVEQRFPVSKLTVGKEGNGIASECLLASLLKQQKVGRVKVRSPFTAIAGKGDKFSSNQDLVLSVSAGPELMLDFASVPTVYTGRTSSYACDFLLHGKLSLLQNDCLIGVSESWKEIDEWRFFLESLNIALEFIFELDNTHEYAHLQKVVKDLTAEIALKLQLEGA